MTTHQPRRHALVLRHAGGHTRLDIDGLEVHPRTLSLEIDPETGSATAHLALPVTVENLEALAALDIDLIDPFPAADREC